jgi:signal peptidase I
MDEPQNGTNHTANRGDTQPTPSPNLHTQEPTKMVRDPISPNRETPSIRPRTRSYAFHSFLSLAQLIIGAVLLAFVINHVVFQPYEVFGRSMTPTLHEGDRLIVNKLGKSWAAVTRGEYIPKRGEIIVFHNPNNESVQLVKRVVGLPGERVVVTAGRITVYSAEEPNGINFDRAFNLELETTTGEVDLIVPDGEIFVVGDNRVQGGSLDSRNELGTVPLNEVVGDLVFRIFPITDAATF